MALIRMAAMSGQPVVETATSAGTMR